jgi:hypothetical protein
VEGIVDEDRAAAVAEHLLGPRLFSAWGVRTMAEGDGGYNPIGYHQGTVWPHDNSFIAAGLRRYGFEEEAATISFAILEAAPYFLGRLPETFAGYARTLTRLPGRVPDRLQPPGVGDRRTPPIAAGVARYRSAGRRHRTAHVPPGGNQRARPSRPPRAGRHLRRRRDAGAAQFPYVSRRRPRWSPGRVRRKSR